MLAMKVVPANRTWEKISGLIFYDFVTSVTALEKYYLS